MSFITHTELPLSVLEILANPVLVKDSELRYVWVNPAFETLFGISVEQLKGCEDSEVFQNRQAVQCTGGDKRVLESGNVDDATETIFDDNGIPRETITRKSRLTLSDGTTFLVGVMHDITDVTRANEQLLRAQDMLEQRSQELLELASTDALTGCANRRALFRQAPRILSAPGSHDWSLLALDIDHFKAINDVHGHDAGDRALEHFANTVRSLTREQDIFARMGGEEFVLLLAEADRAEAGNIADRICHLVETSPFDYDGIRIEMTVSIGLVSAHSRESLTIEHWLMQADKCLYEAKNQGRNRYVEAA